MSDKIFAPGELHAGDFILFEGDAFISRGIQIFSGSKWSHAAIFLGDGYVMEATAAGVEKNLLAPLVKHAKSIAVMRIPDLTVEQMEEMKTAAYTLQTVGTKYDFANLITLAPYFMLRKIGINAPWLVWSRKGEVICSELCARCALVIPLKFAKNPKLVSPGVLYLSKLLIKVLEK